MKTMLIVLTAIVVWYLSLLVVGVASGGIGPVEFLLTTGVDVVIAVAAIGGSRAKHTRQRAT